MVTRSQEKMAEILSLLTNILKTKNKKSDNQPDEQPNTTDMPQLESEELDAQRRKESSSGQELKILAPTQMLSRLPIALAQSEAGKYFLHMEKQRTTSAYKQQ